jgi:hypothetical protein
LETLSLQTLRLNLRFRVHTIFALSSRQCLVDNLILMITACYGHLTISKLMNLLVSRF